MLFTVEVIKIENTQKVLNVCVNLISERLLAMEMYVMNVMKFRRGMSLVVNGSNPKESKIVKRSKTQANYEIPRGK